MTGVQEEFPKSTQGGHPTIKRRSVPYLSLNFAETKKISQEFSRTEVGALGALSNLDDFFWTQNFKHSPEIFQDSPGI